MPPKGQKQTPEAIEKWRKSRQGYVVSEETKKKISDSVKRRYELDETYALRVSEKLKGKCFQTEESRAKISAASKGRKFSPESIEKGASKRRGRHPSEETRKKLSDSHKGQVPWITGKHHSEESNRKNSESHKGKQTGKDNPFYGKHHTKESIQKAADSRRGFHHSEEAKRKIGNASRGPNNARWKGGISYEPYCPLFNEKFKEYIRNKFNRTCYLCGKSEQENITKSGKIRKLSVHHVDYDKNDICNGYSWPFVPICISCHGKTNGDRHYWFNLLISYYVINEKINFSHNLEMWCL